METSIPIVLLIMCSLGITTCANPSPPQTTQKDPNTTTVTESPQPTPTETATTTENLAKSRTAQPTIGTVKELVNGDLLCYVTLIDKAGTEHNLGASFEICEKPEKFLNKKVRLEYTIESVSDCQSAEPCGKTKRESIITKMVVLRKSSRSIPRTKSDDEEESTTSQPKIGTVKELVNGDLLCYATLVDKNGTEHNVGASFDICAEAETFLNKKVRASYTIESVNDCQSAEPCGKTREESIITQMEVLSN